MRPPRIGAALLLLGLLACPARPPEGQEEASAEAAAAPAPPRADEPREIRRHPDDDPLPAPDAIPAFLAPRLPPREAAAEEAQAPADGDLHAPPAGPELGFLSLRVDESLAPAALLPSDPEEAPAGAEGGAEALGTGLPSFRPGEGREPADPPTTGTDETSAPADPCQALRDAIARHQDYLHRIHDERRAFGWVEDDEDGAALRLLESLRRCEAHPEDPDCRPPPLTADLAARTLESHEFSRDPADLNAEGKEPDEIPHDPGMLDLMEKLRRCEAEQARGSRSLLSGP